MRVREHQTTAGTRYVVVDELGNDVGVPAFDTNEAAWRWVDEHDVDHGDAVDRQRRIRMAFGGEDTR